jgi:hypothetical protein
LTSTVSLPHTFGAKHDFCPMILGKEDEFVGNYVIIGRYTYDIFQGREKIEQHL